MMKKIWALAAVAGVMSTTLAPMAAYAADDDIVIGYAAAMTGMYAPYDSVDGAKCEVDRLNDAGGVLGKKLRLEARDMKSDAAVAATAGQELIDLKATAILSPPSDDTSIPIAMLAQPLGIPVLSVASTQAQFPQAAPDNGYLIPYSDNMSAALAAQYAIKKGYKTAVLMITHDVGSYGLMTPEYFGQAFEKLGGKVLKRINYNTGLSDYRAQLAEVEAMNPKPDVIFGGFIVPDGGVFPRQFKSAGVTIPFMGTDGFDDAGILKIAGDAADEITFVTHGFPAEGTTLKEFYADCEKRGYHMQNVFFGLAGEAVLVVKTAIENAGSAEPEKVNAALKEIKNLKGITTSSITYKDRGGIPLKEMSVVHVVNGKFELVESGIPAYIPAP
ncbi:MAG: ABC transporter substrate-binding protein [Parvibaculaceae bacterium]|nr:ABC transporter substrate-binding protein [Parvibaculaceae bacterium]